MESGSFSFSLARQLKEKLGCEIYILDPRKLSIIHQSLKKTDKEDAFKLALMGQRFEKEELPLVHLPDENQEGYRNLLNEHEYWVKNRTRMINRLHGMFTRAGITDMRKTALKSNKQRPIMLDRLPDHFRVSAQRIHESIELANRNVNQIETEIANILKENRKYTELAFSIPGVGPITTFSFLAYIGDGSQFETAHHLTAYIGIVPKVYISGDKVHYGRTVKGVRCVKRVLLQSSWALICSKFEGPLKRFYERMYVNIGKKKAAIATARKIVITFYTMLKTGEKYRTIACFITSLRVSHSDFLCVLKSEAFALI